MSIFDVLNIPVIHNMLKTNHLVNCSLVCKELHNMFKALQHLKVKYNDEIKSFTSRIYKYMDMHVKLWENKICLHGDVYTPQGWGSPWKNNLKVIQFNDVMILKQSGRYLTKIQKRKAIGRYYSYIFCPIHNNLTINDIMLSSKCKTCKQMSVLFKSLVRNTDLRNLFKMKIKVKS